MLARGGGSGEGEEYWDLRELQGAEPGSGSCLFLMVSVVLEPNQAGFPAMSLSSHMTWDK